MDSNFESDIGDMQQIGARRRRSALARRKRKRADPRTFITFSSQDHEYGETSVLNGRTGQRPLLSMGIGQQQRSTMDHEISGEEEDEAACDDEDEEDVEEEEKDGDVEGEYGVEEEDENLPLSQYSVKKRRATMNDGVLAEPTCSGSEEPESTLKHRGSVVDENVVKKTRRQAKKLYATSLMNFMCTSGKGQSALQLKKIRMKRINDIEYGNRNKLVRIVKNVLLEISESFLPNERIGLFLQQPCKK